MLLLWVFSQKFRESTHKILMIYDKIIFILFKNRAKINSALKANKKVEVIL